MKATMNCISQKAKNELVTSTTLWLRTCFTQSVNTVGNAKLGEKKTQSAIFIRFCRCFGCVLRIVSEIWKKNLIHKYLIKYNASIQFNYENCLNEYQFREITCYFSWKSLIYHHKSFTIVSGKNIRVRNPKRVPRVKLVQTGYSYVFQPIVKSAF